MMFCYLGAEASQHLFFICLQVPLSLCLFNASFWPS
jgi:hypothetical protein